MKKTANAGSRTTLQVVVFLAVTLIGALAGYLARGATQETEKPDRLAGTRSMAARLEQITASMDPGHNLFMNAARVRMLDEMMRKKGGNVSPGLQLERAKEQLNAGAVDDAIASLADLEATARAHQLDTSSKNWIEIRLRQAVAQLRRAESDNCILQHNPGSCLFPISAWGVHGEK